MKIKDLMALLRECNPEGEVHLTLPSDMVDRLNFGPGIEYTYTPEVKALWSDFAHETNGLADSVYVSLPEVVVEEFFKLSGSDKTE